MGWLSNIWSDINGSPTEDLALIDNLEIPGQSFYGQSIVPDECYVELYVESLRLEKARKFATTFHGAVYAFETLARLGSTNADLAAISKPDQLAKLDSSALGHVITLSRQLMGPIAWRGGNLHLELGLFSVKEGNLLSPVLDFVTQVSTTAGASFIGAMTPFVPLVTKGMDLLAGQVNDVALEVAVDTDLSLKTTGTYAIIAAPKTKIDPARITIDPADHKLLFNGLPLQSGYCVFSIRQTNRKADFGQISELKDKFSALYTAIQSSNAQVANDALTAFRLAVLTCPDVISSDADQLIAEATKQVNRAFQPAGVVPGGIAAAMKGTLSDYEAKELADLRIYG